MTLQFDTECCREQKRGMLICGLNWGGTPESSMTDPNCHRYYRSFFSDDSEWVLNACKYRSRILSWLNCLGLKLESSPQLAGRLEKSISQCNWLSTQSVNTNGQDNLSVCAENHEFFIEHLRAVEPSLILFLSADLLRAINTEPCLSQVRQILGQPAEMQFKDRDVILNGNKHPRLQIGRQFFSKATAIALPHPAYRGGIADEYIESFRDWIGAELQKYAYVQSNRRD